MNKYVFFFHTVPHIHIWELPSIATVIYGWRLNSLTGTETESALLKDFLMAVAVVGKVLLIFLTLSSYSNEQMRQASLFNLRLRW